MSDPIIVAPVFVIFIVLMSLSVVVLSIWYTVYACIWVYRDAKKLGLDAALWTVLTFLSIIGLIIYLAIIRKEQRNVAHCNQCGYLPSSPSAYCSACGAPRTQGSSIEIPSCKDFVRNIIIFNIALIIIPCIMSAITVAIALSMA